MPKTTIDAVKWLTFQACTFKGRDESHDSNNRENVIELIKLLASFNADVADVVLHKAPQNASYYLHRIQKEILNIFFDKIQRFIREEIDEAKFCIIVNETRESKREQMAIVLRFVDKDGFIKERFFDIVHVLNTTSATLKEEICIILFRHNLSVQNIRGQRHDQLKVAQAEKIVAKLAIDEVKTSKSKNLVRTLKRIGDTRWGSHLGSISSLINMFGATCSILSNVINDEATSTQRANANGVYDKITSFEFVFILHLMRDIMGTINDLCQAFQHIPDMSAHYTSGRVRVCHQRDHITIEHHFQFQQLLTISELCQMLVSTRKSTIYPLVDRLIRLVLTLPVSTATTEPTFLAMKIVKTRLRNRMEDDFLSSYLLTNVEKDIVRDFDVDSIIDVFYVMNERQAQL
ncbi:uncharacterized protein LOC114277602 [Camellia sinensis]|uniref:uncharacterized protein LOC114277602 n=1 Tax=Camellia sinensis TaxID=4442 RepID=UPI001035B342|nr:uncharacterized protein LOC114277602 [Camellia sinensis]